MALEANDIFFRYDRKGPWILEHYSFRIERGERVALLAPSGSGKTTLAMLLAGWRTPARGADSAGRASPAGSGRLPCPVYLPAPRDRCQSPLETRTHARGGRSGAG